MAGQSTNIRRSRLALATVLGALPAAHAPLLAQTIAANAPAAASARGSVEPSLTGSDVTPDGTVAEIIVTAQRRSESVSKVPISLQVITADTLAKQNVIDTRDLATFTPTLIFTNSTSALITSFGLRGIATTAQAPGLQPSTALVVDGVPVYNQGEFISGLGDIERIEILNGPQGTLFGKNSTAGVINIVTKQPVDRFEGSLEASETNDEETYVRGMVNAPIADGVRVRLSGFYRDQKPLVGNLSGRADVFGQRQYGINGKVAVDLSERATFTLAGTYSHADASTGQFVVVGPSTLARAAVAAGLTVPTGRGGTMVNVNAPARDVFTTRNVTGTLQWNLTDNLTITSISNYTHFDDANYIDEDGTPAGSNIGIGYAIPSSSYPLQSLSLGLDSRRYDVEYYSEELRGNLKINRFDLVFGGFYQHVDFRVRQNTPILFAGSFSTNVLSATVRNETGSVFGDATYRLTDRIKIFGGLRYTHETLDEVYNRADYAGPAAVFNPVTGAISAAPYRQLNLTGDPTIDNLSGRAGVQFQPTTNLNFYASYARGYKGPAANTATSLQPGQPVTLRPEKATAYEVGAKLRLFEGKVALNGALFYEKIDDLQITALDPTQVVITSLLLNAGDVKTRGFEGDATWAVTRHFRLNGALAYDKATYGTFSLGCNSVQNATGTCPNYDPTGKGVKGAQNADGLRVSKSPEWKYTVGANYDDKFGNSDIGYFGQLTYTFTTSIFHAADNNLLALEPSHGQLNASVGVTGPNDRWEVSLFGKNLTNEFYYSSLVVGPPVGLPVGYLPRDFRIYGGLRVVTRF